MKVFFDNCTSPVLASTLNGYLQYFQHAAYHIKDVPGLPSGRHSTDEEWIAHLSSSPEEWIFVTGDKRILKNRAERAALRSAGLHGFALAPAYQKMPFHQVASMLIWKWPEIEKVVSLLDPPSMHEIPIRKNAKLRQLPF